MQSSTDRQDSKLIKFMTCSPAGGLPLGFVVTSSENEKTLTRAFEVFKNILPDDAFGKRGKQNGPVLFMTDDADAEINALKQVWPEARLLLCVWHVLNAVWRWLWKSDHQIKKDDRPHLLKQFRALLYADTSDAYEKVKSALLSDKICKIYPNFILHLKNAYLNRKEAWAISVRKELKLPTHSNNTSNFVEASFRLTKDGQFNRTKAYNLPDLLDILLDDSVYYKKRLLDIGNGRFGVFKNTKSRYLLKDNTIAADKIFHIGESHYIVESESSPDLFYHINMISGYCECKAGRNCGPCKHKKAVTKHYGVAEFCVLPELDTKMRAMYHYIAEAVVCKDSWYRDLERPEVIENVSEFVKSRTNNCDILPVPINSIRDKESESDPESIEQQSSDEDEDLALEDFVTAIDDFKNKIKLSYAKDWKKGVKNFTKNLVKLTKGSVNTLKQSLFKLGNEATKQNKSGKKKKRIGKLIPIQVTAKSRRQYKHRGRVVGLLGRRPKDQEQRTQLLVGSNKDNVYHTLPNQKKSKRKDVHSLKHSVQMNKPAAKKH